MGSSIDLHLLVGGPYTTVKILWWITFPVILAFTAEEIFSHVKMQHSTDALLCRHVALSSVRKKEVLK